MKIGFIGLGIMGKPMAKNLVKAGYSLMVNNLTPAPVEELVACGAEAGTQREIAEQCDIVMTMVPNSPQVREIMLGEDGVGAHMKEGSIFVDMSSINPVASKEIAAELAKRNIEMLDAPVSGGCRRRQHNKACQPDHRCLQHPGSFRSTDAGEDG